MISDHWGPVGYASLNGVFSSPLTAAAAIAPTVGVALASGLGSYPALFLVLAASVMRSLRSPVSMRRATVSSRSCMPVASRSAMVRWARLRQCETSPEM